MWAGWGADWPSGSTVIPPLFDSRVNLIADSTGQDYGCYNRRRHQQADRRGLRRSRTPPPVRRRGATSTRPSARRSARPAGQPEVHVRPRLRRQGLHRQRDPGRLRRPGHDLGQVRRAGPARTGDGPRRTRGPSPGTIISTTRAGGDTPPPPGCRSGKAHERQVRVNAPVAVTPCSSTSSDGSSPWSSMLFVISIATFLHLLRLPDRPRPPHVRQELHAGRRSRPTGTPSASTSRPVQYGALHQGPLRRARLPGRPGASRRKPRRWSPLRGALPRLLAA